MPQVAVVEPELVVPSQFDGFVVERPLGRGGMGHVYLGRDTDLDRLVALKFVIAREGGATARERFRREARAIARLSHPNVVNIFRIGEVAEQPYIAYELVPGRSLDRVARPLPWPLALRIAVGIARGLEAVHRANILHRDLKPANVVVSDSGDVKLIDFGLASLVVGEPERPEEVPSPTAPTMENLLLTRPGAILGTPAYIAPEQWCGEAASPRSDVYALGMTLYELLVGDLPHGRLRFDEIQRFLLLREFPKVRSARPDIPEAFATAIDRCLKKDPSERFATGAEVRAVLETAERIFVQAGAVSPAAALHLDSDHAAVASSFVRVKSKGPQFARALYARLFELAPDVRPLFPKDMSAQESKLVHVIEIALDSLSAPDSLDSMLGELGRRHVHYGAKVEHFRALWTALLETLAAEEGDAWTPALAAAWQATFETLEARMRRGMDLERSTAVSGVGRVEVNVLRVPPPIFDLRTPGRPTPEPYKPPRTQYTRSGEADIAFQVFGEGPVDIVVVMGWLSHVELVWGHRAPMDFLRALSSGARVVVYDKRGTGLSERTRENATLDDHVADLVRVCEAAQCSRPVLFGIFDGAAPALLANAIHPERFAGLVLHGTGLAHGWSDERLRSIENEIKTGWGEPVLLDLLAPSLENDSAFRDWMSLYLRMSASPSNASAMLRESAAIDLRALAPHVAAPSLVIHRHGDRFVSFDQGRALAQTLPNAELAELEGVDHLPFVGDTAPLLERVRAFQATLPSASRPAAPMRFVAAVRKGGVALSAEARAVAESLGGAPMEFEGGEAYAFVRLGHAALFVERVRETTADASFAVASSMASAHDLLAGRSSSGVAFDAVCSSLRPSTR